MTEDQSTLASFTDSETRPDEMRSTIEAWIQELTDDVDSAVASEAFQAWLDVQSRFHDYSPRNTLLISQQCPNATRVAGYRTWQTEFNRQVKEGESALWIWAPIITSQCPSCGNSPSYHNKSDCAFDDTPPQEWSRGLVGFKPTAVFDISQTEGEPLPELQTAAHGDTSGLIEALRDCAAEIGCEMQIVDEDAWSHGSAAGVCYDTPDEQTVVEVKARDNRADLAVTLIHEYAHALLHVGHEDTTERPKREVEAEAVAYTVGRYFGLDTSGSAFYLAAWVGDDSETIMNRLGRISRIAETLITAVE